MNNEHNSKKKKTTQLCSVKNWQGKKSNKLFHMISFPLQLFLYPPLHSKNCQDLPAFFLKFFWRSTTGASPSLSAATVSLMENIRWTATKLPFTRGCSNPTKQECLFFRIENEVPYFIQTRFIPMPRFKAEIPSCYLTGNEMKRKS